MGAGKGKARRVNTTDNQYTHILKKPKPKFNLGDKVLINSSPELVAEVLYNRKENGYQYKFKNQESLPAMWRDERELAPVRHSSLDVQTKDCKDYLHKTVTFQYHPDHWDAWDVGEMNFAISSLDNRTARIIGVHDITDQLEFTVQFYGVAELVNQGIHEFYFSKENFKPIIRMKALDIAESDSLPTF